MFDVFRQNLTIIRKEAGSFQNGYWCGGEDASFNITASVQATDAEILQTLPEGHRTTGSYTLLTESKLLTAVTNQRTPDIVIIDDQRYLVARITPWQHLAQTKHYEIVVVRENIDVN